MDRLDANVACTCVRRAVFQERADCRIEEEWQVTESSRHGVQMNGWMARLGSIGESIEDMSFQRELELKLKRGHW